VKSKECFRDKFALTVLSSALTVCLFECKYVEKDKHKQNNPKTIKEEKMKRAFQQKEKRKAQQTSQSNQTINQSINQITLIITQTKHKTPHNHNQQTTPLFP
jgi:hypothetical protein